jgi:hypothetical protein
MPNYFAIVLWSCRQGVDKRRSRVLNVVQTNAFPFSVHTCDHFTNVYIGDIIAFSLTGKLSPKA